MSEEIRKWHVDQAIHSVRSCQKVLMELSLPELEAAIKLESATQRRKKILQRLVGRAVQKNSELYQAHLNSL